MVYKDLLPFAETDVNEVLPQMSVDLEACIESGAVPPNASDLSYNEQDLETIGERIHDSFDAIEGNSYYDRLSREAAEMPSE